MPKKTEDAEKNKKRLVKTKNSSNKQITQDLKFLEQNSLDLNFDQEIRKLKQNFKNNQKFYQQKHSLPQLGQCPYLAIITQVHLITNKICRLKPFIYTQLQNDIHWIQFKGVYKYQSKKKYDQNEIYWQQITLQHVFRNWKQKKTNKFYMIIKDIACVFYQEQQDEGKYNLLISCKRYNQLPKWQSYELPNKKQYLIKNRMIFSFYNQLLNQIYASNIYIQIYSNYQFFGCYKSYLQEVYVGEQFRVQFQELENSNELEEIRIYRVDLKGVIFEENMMEMREQLQKKKIKFTYECNLHSLLNGLQKNKSNQMISTCQQFH